jgi:hypothetical protein
MHRVLVLLAVACVMDATCQACSGVQLHHASYTLPSQPVPALLLAGCHLGSFICAADPVLAVSQLGADASRFAALLHSSRSR